MLALRTMVGDELKDDVNNANGIFKEEFYDILHNNVWVCTIEINIVQSTWTYFT